MLRSPRTSTSAFIIFLFATVVVAIPAASAGGIRARAASLNTVPPTVSIDTPAPGATVSGTITVAGRASDDLGVMKVKYRVDTRGDYQLAAGTTVWSGSIDTKAYTNGAHVLSVRAIDNSGNGTTATVSFVTANGSVPPGPGPNPSPNPGPNPTPTPGLPGPEPTGPGGGVFSVSCELDHQAKDDPIVFFGQPLATHFHDFFGAKGVDASTRVGDLRARGTTCGNSGDTAAYWAPSLIGPDGTVIRPSNMLAYYQSGTAVRAFPQGLKMIADFGGHPNTGFGCSQSGPFSPTPVSCPGGTLKMHVHFPFCWDGVNLDSPDHRSHMSFKCDASYPIELVHMHIHIQYQVTGGSAYHLAPSPDGSIPAVHSDFMNGWDQAALVAIVADCINAGRDCKKMLG